MNRLQHEVNQLDTFDIYRSDQLNQSDYLFVDDENYLYLMVQFHGEGYRSSYDPIQIKIN